MSLRQALKRSRAEQETSGDLVERRLGGVVWFEAPKVVQAQIYREGRPAGNAEALYGATPRGTPKPTSATWSERPEDDRENDLVGRRATRILLQEGRRVTIRCLVSAVADVGPHRFYLCKDADDGLRSVLDAKACRDAVDAADEKLCEEKEKKLKVEKGLRKEERLALEKDARAAADAADAAMEAEEEKWFFRCPCGVEGAQHDDGKDMVQCATCLEWAHDACVVMRLRGFRGASKLSALRQGAYLCTRCAPRRYRSMSCACATDERCPACRSSVTPPRPPAKTRTAPTGHPALPELRVYTDPKHRDAAIIQEVITGGCYERPAHGFEIVPGDVWLDIGAHIGAFSSVCLAGGADVIAVEPDAANFALLEYNGAARLALDPCPGTFVALRTAVLGSSATEATLYAHPTQCAFRHSTHRLALAQRRGLAATAWTGCTVKATSLPVLLETYPDINAVKVDAQGAEIEIIESVRDWRNVEKLVLEYDFEYLPSLPSFHRFIEQLRRHFPNVRHCKLKKTGDFVGFPNGVLVFATREASSRRVTL